MGRQLVWRSTNGDLYMLQTEQTEQTEENEIVAIGGPYRYADLSRLILMDLPLSRDAAEWAKGQKWNLIADLK